MALPLSPTAERLQEILASQPTHMTEEPVLQTFLATNGRTLTDFVIDMNSGHPRAVMANELQERAAELNAQQGNYTPSTGTLQSRTILAEFINWLLNPNNPPQEFTAENVAILRNGTQAFSQVFELMAGKDGVVFVAAGNTYNAYIPAARITGASVESVPTNGKNYPSEDDLFNQIAAALDAGKPRAVLALDFGNPSGRAPSKQEAQSMANAVTRLVAKYGDRVGLLLDDPYAFMTRNGSKDDTCLYNYLSEGAKDNTVLADTGSKRFALTSAAGLVASRDKRFIRLLEAKYTIEFLSAQPKDQELVAAACQMVMDAHKDPQAYFYRQGMDRGLDSDSAEHYAHRRARHFAKGGRMEGENPYMWERGRAYLAQSIYVSRMLIRVAEGLGIDNAKEKLFPNGTPTKALYATPKLEALFKDAVIPENITVFGGTSLREYLGLGEDGKLTTDRHVERLLFAVGFVDGVEEKDRTKGIIVRPGKAFLKNPDDMYVRFATTRQGEEGFGVHPDAISTLVAALKLAGRELKEPLRFSTSIPDAVKKGSERLLRESWMPPSNGAHTNGESPTRWARDASGRPAGVSADTGVAEPSVMRF